LIGPFVLPSRLNGNNYLQFLCDIVPELLEDVMLIVRNQMWYSTMPRWLISPEQCETILIKYTLVVEWAKEVQLHGHLVLQT